MTADGLFAPATIALHRRSDPDTSRAAAALVATKVARLEQIVLDALERAGSLGMTVLEIAHASGEAQVSISPRPAQLKRRGLVADSGRRRDRSIVWVLARYARQVPA